MTGIVVPYTIDEMLHSGARSVIYRGHREGDGCSVVFKVLRTLPAPSDQVDRFRREYELTQSLGLRSVIGCHDFLTEADRVAMVLEDFGGRSLDQLGLAGNIDVHTFLEIASACVVALADLHERRVVHGNLSPSNIVFNPQSGQLKLIDFGCALDLSVDSPGDSAPTHEIELAYASPEQAGRHLGTVKRRAAVDYRSDLYSLGVTLYELWTGCLPFADDSASTTRGGRPVPPHQVREGFSERVSEIVLKLIETDPDRRYRSAAELMADLGPATMAEIAGLNRKLRQERDLHEQALADLQQAYEEIQTQEEDLREQTQELIAIHAQIDSERRRYQELFALAPDGYLVTDLKGIIRETNQAAADLLGVDPRFAAKLPLASFVQAVAERRDFQAVLQRMRASTATVEWEGRLAPRGREPVDVIMRCSAVRDGAGVATGARWLIRDVTEKKRGEEALRLSEERFRLMAENSDDVIYRATLAPTPALDYISPSVTALTGFTPDELYADPDLTHTLLATEDLPKVEAILSDPTQGIGSQLLRWRRKDGGVIWTDQRNVPIFDEAGKMVAVAGVARDVTARKLAEDALREREHLIEKITTSSPHLICLLDVTNQRIVYTNRSLAHLLGYTLEEGQVLGLEKFYELLHPDDKESAAMFLKGMAATADDDVHSTEARLLDAQGAYRWIAGQYVVFARNKDGTAAEVLGTLTDITESKEVEVALQESEELFRTSVENLQDAFGIYSAVRGEAGNIIDFKIEYVNPVASILNRYKPEEMMGHTLLEFLPPGSESALDQYRKVVETGEPLTMESLVYERDFGNQHISLALDARVARFRDGFVATWRDVTERKQREDLLLEREQFIKRMTEVTPGAIYVYDMVEDRIVYVTGQVEQITGLAPQQVMDLGPSLLHELVDFGELLPQMDVLQERFARAQDGEVIEFEQKLTLADGSSRWILTRGVIFTRDSTGAPTQMLGVAFDISERKRDEDRVKQAYEGLYARVNELSALNRIGHLLTTVTNITSSLPTVCKILLDTFNASEVSIAELNPSRSELAMLAHVTRGEGGRNGDGCRVALEDEPVARRAVQEGQPLVMSTNSARPPSWEALDPISVSTSVQKCGWIFTPDVKSLIVQPLRSRGNIIGLLSIATDQDDALWTQSEVLFSQTVAGTLAGAIANARLFTEEQSQRLLAESLHEVGSVLAGSLDIEIVLNTLFGQLRRVLDYDGAILYLRDRDDLVASRAVGISARHTGYRFDSTSKGPQMSVLKSGKARCIPDTLGYVNWTPPAGSKLVRSWMGAPLILGDVTMGILTVLHREPDTYTTSHLRVLRSFANEAAVAISNARRYQEVQAIAAYEERNRLARELHDSVTQSLFSANLVAEVLPELARNSPETFDRSVETLARLTQSALAEMRTMLMELRPSSLVQAPLDSVIKNLITTIASRSQLEMVRSRLDPVPPLPEEVQVALYRIVQETLTNVVKHSQARQAEFDLRVLPPFRQNNPGPWEGEIAIHVADNGKGFDANAIPAGHLGLQIMRERAASIGATLEVTSEPGHGTQITITWAGKAAVPGRATDQVVAPRA